MSRQRGGERAVGRTAALTALALLASSCGDRPAIPLGPTPASVTQECEHLCPRLFPRRPGSRVLVQSLTPRGYHGYLASFNSVGFPGGDAGHVILGSQPHPLHPGWRTDAQMKLPGLRSLKVLKRVEVNGAPGVVLRAPPYPAGGVHGGHVIVLWNGGGRGYLVSLHFARYPEAARVAAAIRIARSTTAR